jgi:sugar O-acyltransferase (sialic acid O-acetyltransferase NeuD family)
LEVLIIGAGGFGCAVADALMAGSAYVVAGFLDDRSSELDTVLGHPVLGRITDLKTVHQAHSRVVVAIGNNDRRRELCLLAQSIGFELVTVVHPRAIVSPHAHIAPGAMVMAGAVVGTEAQVGLGAIVNTAAVVDHHASVGEFAHLGVGACMAGHSALGPGAWLQEGCVLRSGQAVAEGAVLESSSRGQRP